MNDEVDEELLIKSLECPSELIEKHPNASEHLRVINYIAESLGVNKDSPTASYSTEDQKLLKFIRENISFDVPKIFTRPF